MSYSEKLTYKNFSLGWIADSVEKDPDNIPEDAVQGLVGLEQADNADINGLGGISKRRGSAKLNTVSYAATCKQVEEWLKSDGTVQLVAVIDTDFCAIAEADGAATVVQALDASADKVFCFPTITGGADKFYFGDAARYFVWDGTLCEEVTPPGTYELLEDLMTQYIAHCAMGAGTHTAADVVNNNPVAIASTLVADMLAAAVSLKAKYNAHDVETGTYHPAPGTAHQVAAANPTTIATLITFLTELRADFVAHMADAVAHAAADVTNVVTVANVTDDLANVRKCHMAVYHTKSHRYFYASLDYSWVLYSEPDEPDNVKTLSILYPGQVEGNMVGLEIFGDAVVARFVHGGYVWRGVDPRTDVIWWPIPLKTGGFNPWDSAVVDGGLLFPGMGGIYELGMSLLGANVTVEESGDVVPNIAEKRVTSVIDAILNKDIICTVDDLGHGKTYIAYTDDTNSYTKNVKVLVNHRRNGGGFTRYLGWQVNHWCLRKNGDLLYATENYIMKSEQDTYNDNGAAIHFKVKTKWINLGFLGFMKKLFVTTITSQQNDNTSTIDVTVTSDNGVDTVSKTGISLNSGFIWGMIYGPVWVGASIITKWFDSILEAMRFQVTLENNVLNESVDLYGLGFQFKVGKPSGERVA